MPNAYRTTVVAIAVHREGESPIHGEGVTTIRLDDEGGGSFLVLTQGTDELRLDPDEIRVVLEAAERLAGTEGRQAAQPPRGGRDGWPHA